MSNTDIPKVIHYCWFGGKPLPETAVKCIESWRRFMPGWEIRRWDESNFPVDAIPYTAQAYRHKKYAFVSDYARFKILYDHGGVYFDTDVELIAPIDDIIARGPFMGCEKPAAPGATPGELGVAPGLGLGVNPGLGLVGELLDLYATLQFERPDGSPDLTTIVDYTGRILERHGLRNTPELQQVGGVWIYPNDYFAPKNVDTRELTITANTRSIHHYDATWASPASRKSGIRAPKLRRMLGTHLGNLVNGTIFWLQEYGLIGSIKRIFSH